MRKFEFKVGLCILFFTLGAHAGALGNLRGARYCEVLLLKKSFEAEVYNTLGLNDCPVALWSHLSKQKIKQENDARVVELNGPRYFMMDEMKDTSLISRERKSFDGLSMRLAGIVHVKMSAFLDRQTYQTHEVDRHTTWVYRAGRPVYELISPEGDVYVMQSYSVQYHYQNKNTLASLGKNLKLPPAWRFRTGLLKKTSEVTAAHNKAVVIQDDYRNTYQLASKDLLQE
jgi:hypothetical protein